MFKTCFRTQPLSEIKAEMNIFPKCSEFSFDKSRKNIVKKIPKNPWKKKILYENFSTKSDEMSIFFRFPGKIQTCGKLEFLF